MPPAVAPAVVSGAIEIAGGENRQTAGGKESKPRSPGVSAPFDILARRGRRDLGGFQWTSAASNQQLMLVSGWDWLHGC